MTLPVPPEENRNDWASRPDSFDFYLVWVSIVLVFFASTGKAASRETQIFATSSSINGPTALALDNEGHLFVIEGEEDKVHRIDLNTGTIAVVAGYGRNTEKDCIHQDGIEATKACLKYPVSLALDSSGNLFIGEISGYVRKVDVGSGLIFTVAGSGHGGDTVEGSSALAADFWSVDGLALDSDGDLFIADAHQEKIFKLDSKSGLITRAAGNGKRGFGGDGEIARNASFHFANSISLENDGSLLIADYGNCRIRRVEHSTGTVRTIVVTGEVRQDGSCKAGNLEAGPYPSDAVADSTGNVYFIEGAMDIVRSLDVHQRLSTVVGTGEKGYKGDGGSAGNAQLNNPSGLAIDRDGNLYISEFVSNRIRRVDAKTKVITTVAGNGLPHRFDIQL